MLKVFAIDNTVQISITGENLIGYGEAKTIGTISGAKEGKYATITAADAIHLRNILNSMDLDNYHVDHEGLDADESLAENLIRATEATNGEDVDIAPGMRMLPLCFKCDREPTCASAYMLDSIVKCPLEPIS